MYINCKQVIQQHQIKNQRDIYSFVHPSIRLLFVYSFVHSIVLISALSIETITRTQANKLFAVHLRTISTISASNSNYNNSCDNNIPSNRYDSKSTRNATQPSSSAPAYHYHFKMFDDK
uniref:Uncharacterized protein n=1 Tax=Glossina brevipalpis TaxID=37001 RepID=A0A1A9X4L7_9MUSC